MGGHTNDPHDAIVRRVHNSPVTSSALWIVDASGEYKTPTNIASTIVTFPHISHCLEMNPRTPTPMTPTEQERHDRTQQAAQPPSNLPSQAAGVHVAEEGPKQPTAKATVPPVKVESQAASPLLQAAPQSPQAPQAIPVHAPADVERQAARPMVQTAPQLPPPPYAMPGHAQANVRPQAANQAPFIHSAPQLPHPPAMSVHAPGVAGQSQQQQPPRVPMHVQPLVQVFLSPLQLQQLQMLMQAERGHPTQQQQQAQQEHPNRPQQQSQQEHLIRQQRQAQREHLARQQQQRQAQREHLIQQQEVQRGYPAQHPPVQRGYPAQQPEVSQPPPPYRPVDNGFHQQPQHNPRFMPGPPPMNVPPPVPSVHPPQWVGSLPQQLSYGQPGPAQPQQRGQAAPPGPQLQQPRQGVAGNAGAPAQFGVHQLPPLPSSDCPGHPHVHYDREVIDRPDGTKEMRALSTPCPHGAPENGVTRQGKENNRFNPMGRR